MSSEIARLASLARDWCQAQSETAIQLLESLVNIDSGSDHADGLNRVISAVGERWSGLGFATGTLRTPTGGPILVAERLVSEESPTILFLIHLDTVFPSGTAAARPFMRSADRAFGPGVADMKGGAVVAAMAVEAAIKTAGLETTNVIVLCNTDEEIGSVESRSVIIDKAQGADLSLVFEPARPDGSIVTARRGLRRYRLSVRGRAAHTGVEPWAGANAIVSLAGKVLDVDGLSDHDSGLSITVSRISGGTRVNIVPDVASAEIDVRVPDMPTAIEIDARLCDVAMREDIAGTTGELELFAERPPFVESASAGPAIDLYRQAAAALDMDHATGMTGGGSDGCFTSAAGVPTVDGLGPVGGGYHTDQEYVRLSTLAERAALTATVLGALELGSK